MKRRFNFPKRRKNFTKRRFIFLKRRLVKAKSSNSINNSLSYSYKIGNFGVKKGDFWSRF